MGTARNISDEILLPYEGAVERDLEHLEEFFVDHAYVRYEVPKTKGGFIIFVRFLLPLRLKEPKQLQ